jgi:hypothetical protein
MNGELLKLLFLGDFSLLQDPSGVTKEEFVRVDVEYVRTFAKLCKSAGVKHISMVQNQNCSFLVVIMTFFGRYPLLTRRQKQ